MTQVEYRKLGKSGLRVSVPILGMMSMGCRFFHFTTGFLFELKTNKKKKQSAIIGRSAKTNIYIFFFFFFRFQASKWEPWVLDREEALPILKRAYDLGITTWDTANAYSNGISEKLIGEAIQRYSIPREEIVILTKIYYPVPPESEKPGDAFLVDLRQHAKYVNQFGLSRGAIFKQVDACLKRLNTDYIDLLQIHRYDKSIEPEEVMEALHDLVKSGKVRYIGASSMWLYEFARLQHVAELRGWTTFVSMQNIYNLLYREEEREVIPFSNLTGVGLTPWSPLHQGILARPIDNTAADAATATVTATAPVATADGKKSLRTSTSTGVFKQLELDVSGKEIVRRLEQVANKRDWSMAVTALVWLTGKVVSPVVGINSIKRLEEVIEINGKSLTDEEIKYLEEPYTPQQIFGHF
ncbi:NADP-dependent oxidoreductase domain-containing protein [Lipomyces japonicus]|uniref:NADP-dependent oxidoreductase domain-containing protein n=1 Tax=Lipomyces japonicus TaxID=56871 RepID=UPI0034CDD6C7